MIKKKGIHEFKNKYFKPVILISFDDGNISDYTYAYPIMSARGIKGTSFINTSTIGSGAHKMTWDNVKQMYASGWYMGCHTHNHINLVESTETEIENDLLLVNQAFIANGLPIPQHHAYPYGVTSPSIMVFISQYRKSARWTIGYSESASKGHNTFGGVNYYRINNTNISITNNAQLENVKKEIRLAIKNKRVISLYTHNIVDSLDPVTIGSGNCGLSFFIEIMDFIKNTGVETMNFNEFYEYSKEIDKKWAEA